MSYDCYEWGWGILPVPNYCLFVQVRNTVGSTDNQVLLRPCNNYYYYYYYFHLYYYYMSNQVVVMIPTVNNRWSSTVVNLKQNYSLLLE